MIEIIHQEQTEEKVQRELPREIKQIGSPDAGERIYVEDTVYRRMHLHGQRVHVCGSGYSVE